MKFTLFSLLSLSALAVAMPAAAPGQGGAGGNGGPGGPGGPGPPGVLAPDAISQYHVWTGAIDYNTGVGKIFKDQVTSDISTLLTFTFPPETAGKSCSIELVLNSASTLTGTPAFDIFSSLYPATSSTTSWPPGNGRDQDLGRADAVIGGFAIYEPPPFPQIAANFPCPAPGTVQGYELVPTGDQTDIEWVQNQLVGAVITFG